MIVLAADLDGGFVLDCLVDDCLVVLMILLVFTRLLLWICSIWFEIVCFVWMLALFGGVICVCVGSCFVGYCLGFCFETCCLLFYLAVGVWVLGCWFCCLLLRFDCLFCGRLHAGVWIC